MLGVWSCQKLLLRGPRVQKSDVVSLVRRYAYWVLFFSGSRDARDLSVPIYYWPIMGNLYDWLYWAIMKLELIDRESQ